MSRYSRLAVSRVSAIVAGEVYLETRQRAAAVLTALTLIHCSTPMHSWSCRPQVSLCGQNADGHKFRRIKGSLIRP